MIRKLYQTIKNYFHSERDLSPFFVRTSDEPPCQLRFARKSAEANARLCSLNLESKTEPSN